MKGISLKVNVIGWLEFLLITTMLQSSTLVITPWRLPINGQENLRRLRAQLFIFLGA